MKAERKQLSKKIRFEVFKRDDFTCQYCGRKAPDVTLHVDHINPVHNGGQNDIVNLITSCSDCNLGKKHTLLSDKTVVEKREKQVRILYDKKNKVDAIIQKQKKVHFLVNYEFDSLLKFYNSHFKHQTLDYVGRVKLGKLLKKHGLERVTEQIAVSFKDYRENNQFTKCRLLIDVVENKLNPPKENKYGYLLAILRNGSYGFKINHFHFIMKQIDYTKEIDNLIEMAKRKEFRDFDSFQYEIQEINKRQKRMDA